MLRYGDAKRIVTDRFQRGIVSEQDAEINRLQGLVTMLEGHHQQGSREYNALVMKSRTAFQIHKGVASMDRRDKMLKTKSGQLDGLISQMQSIRRQIADTRLICELLHEQSEKDRKGRERVFQKGVDQVEARRAELIRKLNAKKIKERQQLLEREAEESELLGLELDSATQHMPASDFEQEEHEEADPDEQEAHMNRIFDREHPELATSDRDDPFA